MNFHRHTIDFSIYDACRAYMLDYYYNRKVIVYGDSNVIKNNIIKNTSDVDTTRFVKLIDNEFSNEDTELYDVENWLFSTIEDGFVNDTNTISRVTNTMIFMREFIKYTTTNHIRYVDDDLIHSLIDKVAVILADPEYKNELLYNDDKQQHMIRKNNIINIIHTTMYGTLIGGLVYYIIHRLVVKLF
ncbi:ankyrin-repeat protein [Murmansk poxvirus]|uniref:Ankyrin-repeat protein n=1 Tax=Murmansk poxvirus TaxID=2025359 RepID=A0A223FN11_9POXV|nr:ankyrin-repeat protein [Murmansk poxvirus]AST09375.1 ankyrin-repeat protein [Murmansk poxvirus]